MDEREYPSTTRKASVERSNAEIRQEIAAAKENISLPVEEIGKSVHEKLDWRGYLKASPYWALGAAAGLGYLGSRLFVKRTTPMKRIMRPIAGGFRGSVAGLLSGAAGSGLIKVTLIGMATKAAARWIENAISGTGTCNVAGTPPQTARDSLVGQRVRTQQNSNING